MNVGLDYVSSLISHPSLEVSWWRVGGTEGLVGGEGWGNRRFSWRGGLGEQKVQLEGRVGGTEGLVRGEGWGNRRFSWRGGLGEQKV